MAEKSATRSPETLSGLIERVTFFNEENGFAVLRIKVKGQRDLATVVGNMPSVSAGEWLSAEGCWVVDKEHGRQFKAEAIKSAPPTTREGIEKYLGSGLIKGIGPTYAKKLVDHFGEKIFDVIDDYSARLEEVDGIGPGRRKKIKAAWAEQKIVRDIMVFLHSHGVSTSRAVRIYKTYGEKAIDTVRSNPYLLARDIRGIGFKSADQIARRLGIAMDSPVRAGAALEHVLLEATQAGHCGLPEEMLIEETRKLLEVEEHLISQVLEQKLALTDLYRETFGGQEMIFHPNLRWAEEGITTRLTQLAAQPPGYPPIQLEKAIEWCQEKTGVSLAPTQREALAKALNNRVLVITGGPGVGKTTLLNSILKILRAKRVECLLCAPTGRAAKRLSETTGHEAKTIHRLLEVQPGSGKFGRNESHPLECQLLVVDETSMVDVPLMHHLLRALPPYAHLILVGDVDQLPSVGPGMVLRHVIESGVAAVVRLTEVFRQAAHSQIITTAHQINEGQLPDQAPKDREVDFYFLDREDPDAIRQTILELVKERIPKKYECDPLTDIQVLCPMRRGSLGAGPLNDALQSVLNPHQANEPVVEKFGFHFRKRDKVIQTENDYNKEIFNGDLGQITGIDPVESEVTVEFDGRKVLYDFGELDELTPAYAITIHKSQGSEFPIVVIPLATQQYIMLQRNLIYTGITRGRRLVVVVGQKKALALAVQNSQTRERYSGLLERLQRAKLTE